MKFNINNRIDFIKNAAPIFFASIVSIGYFVCMYFLLTKSFPAENKDPLNTLLTVLTTIFTLQMNFFFGSSANSKAKDETISDIAKGKPRNRSSDKEANHD